MAELPFPAARLANEIFALRPWRETDVPAMVTAFGDPVVERFSWPRTTRYTEADARVSLMEQEQGRRRGEQVEFAFVEPADDDALLGGASLYDGASPTPVGSPARVCCGRTRRSRAGGATR